MIESLKTKEEFLKLYRQGKKLVLPNFTIYFLSGRQREFKVAITVSKKVFKRAVKRNSIKRRILAIIRGHQKFLESRITQLLVVVRPEAERATFSQLKQDLERFLKKISSYEKSFD